jgi:hypothetical protein
MLVAAGGADTNLVAQQRERADPVAQFQHCDVCARRSDPPYGP